jgi:hypothetical protein
VRESLVRAVVCSWPKALRTTVVLVLVVVWSLGLAAQQPPDAKTGNPTPGTPQPAPPNLADRITLSGCVQAVGGDAAGPAAAIDSNGPSAARFVLVKAERLHIVPPDTGTSAEATSAPGGTYRLSAIDSQLSPFVGTKVEISGEVVRLPGSPGDRTEKTPVLQVEFIQKLSPTCP